MEYLFRISLKNEDYVRGTSSLVDRLRELRRSGTVADITVHAYEGSLGPKNHLGSVGAARILMARDFDPAWLE